jgi:predicted RNase H-like HicB family nuclease
MNSMELEVRLYQDEDGVWIAECPAIPGCVSQGATEQEAMANVQEAIKLCLEVRKERGMPPVVQHRIVRISA